MQIEWLSWDQARPDIAAANSQFADVIDQLNLEKKHRILKVCYPYGQHILQQGQFLLPNSQGEFVTCNDPSLPIDVAAAFDYIHTIPLAVVLRNSAEIFLSANDSITPFRIINPGDIVSIWNVLESGDSCDRGNLWNIVAGGRSLFLLPKVSDSIAHKRIQKAYDITTPAPRTTEQQWGVFSRIAQREEAPWQFEVMFFTKEWLEERKQPSWQLFRYYLLQEIWNKTAYLRNQYYNDYIFSCMKDARGIKPDPFLADTVKHILTMAAGSVPGFAVANDEKLGPIRFFQQAYLDEYQLKDYAPIFLRPSTFNLSDSRAMVYYSLAFPTLLEFSAASRKLSTKLSDIRNVQYILQHLSKLLETNPYALDEHAVSPFTLLQKIHYAFFHSDVEGENHIEPATKLVEKDPCIQAELARFPGRTFCENSAFLKGCIQISPKAL